MQIVSMLLDRAVNPDLLNRHKQVILSVLFALFGFLRILLEKGKVEKKY